MSLLEEVAPADIYAWNRKRAATPRQALADANVSVLRLPACVGGSWLVPRDALARGDWANMKRSLHTGNLVGT